MVGLPQRAAHTARPTRDIVADLKHVPLLEEDAVGWAALGYDTIEVVDRHRVVIVRDGLQGEQNERTEERKEEKERGVPRERDARILPASPSAPPTRREPHTITHNDPDAREAERVLNELARLL